MRMISFEGDTALYINDLVMVVFTSIKHSADWYFGSFREHESASTFVQWAKEQIQLYVDMFRTQAYNSDVNQKMFEECVQTTFQQSKRLLGENGLDFSFLLEQISTSSPEGRMPTFRKRLSTNRGAYDASGRSTNPATPNPSPRLPRPSRNMVIPPRSLNRPGSVIDRDA